MLLQTRKHVASLFHIPNGTKQDCEMKKPKRNKPKVVYMEINPDWNVFLTQNIKPRQKKKKNT